MRISSADRSVLARLVALAPAVGVVVLAATLGCQRATDHIAAVAAHLGEHMEQASAAHATPGHDADEHEHGAAAGDRDKVDADGVVRRGQALTASLATTPVAVAIASAKDLDGKRVKLTGKVSDVCSRMGCWFVVQGDKPEDHIRISTRSHDIFVPHGAVGMTAVVEGTLSMKVLDARTAEHLASESGDNKPTAGEVEIGIDVVGLEMSKG